MNNLKTIFMMSAYQSFNAFFYILGKIPILGRFINSGVYKLKKTKKFIFIVSMVTMIITSFLQKAFNLFLCSSIASSLFKIFELEGKIEIKDFQAMFFVLLYFWIKTIFSSSVLYSKDNQTVACIKIMGIRPKAYYYSGLLVKELLNFLINIPAFAIFLSLAGYGFKEAFSFNLFVLGFSVFFYYFATYLHGKDEDHIFRGYYILVILGSILGIIVLALAVLGKIGIGFIPFFHPIAGLVGLLLGIASIFIYKSSNRVDELAKIGIKRTAVQAGENDDINAQLYGVKLEKYNLDNRDKSIEKLKGIEYINKIFYKRMSKVLWKKALTKTGVVSVIGLGILLAGSVFDMSKMGSIEDLFASQLFPVSIFLSYMIYNSDYFTKFCFYHLDRILMRDSAYRKGENISSLIKSRFVKILSLSTPVTVVYLLGLSGIFFRYGGRDIKILLPILAFNLFLSVFYSLHFLYMYFSIQPYTASLKSKVPIYTVINVLIYMGALIFNNLADVIGKSEVMIVWMLIGIYIPIGYFMTLKSAKKNFKLRTE